MCLTHYYSMLFLKNKINVHVATYVEFGVIIRWTVAYDGRVFFTSVVYIYIQPLEAKPDTRNSKAIKFEVESETSVRGKGVMSKVWWGRLE